MNTLPIPTNEMERITTLAEFDLDYSNLESNFKDLCKLAAKVAGTDISLINLIDTYTQWTISSHGLVLNQMPREDSVCQYTIVSDKGFEVPNMKEDDRFSDKFYVAGELGLTYYFGVPLQSSDGLNIGALCVLDTKKKELPPEKVELLKIISDEIVNRLNALRVIESLKYKVSEITETQKRVVHDIRGPLSGIIGLAEIISKRGDTNEMDQVLEFIKLIHKSSYSILELANEILSTKDKEEVVATELKSNQFNLVTLKEKLETLYHLQANNKHIRFTVTIKPDNEVVPFPKNKLLQIIGNLVSNAIKFTPNGSEVTVTLELVKHHQKNSLNIWVKDLGVGMDQSTIDFILSGQSASTDGTNGEQGYGFGLALVKHLVDSLKGEMTITSILGKESVFEVRLPLIK